MSTFDVNCLYSHSGGVSVSHFKRAFLRNFNQMGTKSSSLNKELAYKRRNNNLF